MDVSRSAVAELEATKNLLAIPDESEGYRMVRIQLKMLMRDVTREAWDKDPELARAYEEKSEGRMRGTVWVTLPMMLPLYLGMKNLPSEQVGVVDRESGEATCSEDG